MPSPWLPGEAMDSLAERLPRLTQARRASAASVTETPLLRLLPEFLQAMQALPPPPCIPGNSNITQSGRPLWQDVLAVPAAGLAGSHLCRPCNRHHVPR